MGDDELTDDPCRAENTSSGPRVFAFVLIFVSMFGFAAFALMANSFPGMVAGSVLGYSAMVVLYGFARNRNRVQPFLFTCPVVVCQYPRLLKRHLLFLVILVAILATAHAVTVQALKRGTASRMSDASYFGLAIPIAALGLIEVMTNRGVLERAHDDHFGEPPAPDDPA
ncbi:MAG TPA: hypothetical protein VGI45_08760 [Terracidiphilus sp.]